MKLPVNNIQEHVREIRKKAGLWWEGLSSSEKQKVVYITAGVIVALFFLLVYATRTTVKRTNRISQNNQTSNLVKFDLNKNQFFPLLRIPFL